MKLRPRFTAIMVALALGLSGCGSSASTSTAPADTAQAPTQPAAPTALQNTTPATNAAPSAIPTNVASAFSLSSSAFETNAPIPDKYSCHGGGTSPALSWTTPPAGTQSLALTVEDPDAVKVAGHVWDHWVIFNIPATATTLAEGVPAKAELGDGSLQGQNSSGGAGYQGPCPPTGQTHSYVFTLYAVDSVLTLKAGVSKADLLKALEGHTLAKAELVGRYPGP